MGHTTAIRCDLEYDIATPSHFMLQLECAHSPDQRVVQESLVLSPDIALRSYWDPSTGNRSFRFDAGPGLVRVRYEARVDMLRAPQDETLAEADVTALPDEVMHYLLPSRFCESDLLSGQAQQLFGHLPRGWTRVAAISQWIRDNVAYRVGTSGATTTALDVVRERMGVCRDFSHLLIAFCRALNIPARLVVGYVAFPEPPQDFHAVAEAWLGGRWVMFDATAMAPVDELVRVGTGRDAKDLAFATMYGAMQMTHMHLQVHPDGTPTLDDPDPEQATVRRLPALA